MLKHYPHLYIDGRWIEPSRPGLRELIDPTTEEPHALIASGGGVDDVDLAVAAAKRAFATFSRTSVRERIELIDAHHSRLRTARGRILRTDRARSRRARQLQGSGDAARRAT